MKTLILIRHAKSDWGSPRLADHDRPLNARGRISAEAIGTWLRARRHVPSCALVSTALRARQTWDGVSTGLDSVPHARFVERLYLASPEIIFDEITAAHGSALAVIGHNPGFAAIAARLASSLPRHPDAARFPTCATLVLRFAISSWSELEDGAGQPIDFAVPRDLVG